MLQAIGDANVLLRCRGLLAKRGRSHWRAVTVTVIRSTVCWSCWRTVTKSMTDGRHFVSSVPACHVTAADAAAATCQMTQGARVSVGLLSKSTSVKHVLIKFRVLLDKTKKCSRRRNDDRATTTIADDWRCEHTADNGDKYIRHVVVDTNTIHGHVWIFDQLHGCLQGITQSDVSITRTSYRQSRRS